LEVGNRAVQPIQILLIANTATGSVAAGEDCFTGVEELGEFAARANSELECHRAAQQEQGSSTYPSNEATICLVHQQTPEI